jgi:Ca2+-transporting ATPase
MLPPVKGASAVVIFLRQFVNPLMGALTLGMVASLAIAYYKEASVIGVAILLTAIIGFIQEWKAEREIELLKTYDIDYAKVRRDGQVYSIPVTDVVPGDIMLLELGMKIAADVRLTQVNNLHMQEALLTGEAKPVAKYTHIIDDVVTVGDRSNMVYAGTFVADGEGEGIVVATGQKTYVGSLSHLLSQIEHPRTPLQDQIQRLSWWLGILFCCVTVVVAVVGYWRGMRLLDVVITGIALAVAAIPESLPIALTVILAIGMRRMVKRNALVRHLVAAETLGSVSVICTDKTGTLTQGKMQVVGLVSSDQTVMMEQQRRVPALSEATQFLLASAILNTDIAIKQETGDLVGSATEVALAEYAHRFHVHSGVYGIEAAHVQEIPFSSDRKFKATLHRAGNAYTIITKGAPEKVLSMCEQNRFCSALRQKAQVLTKQGLRLLAVAIKKVTTQTIEAELVNMQCLGLIALQDPLREQAATTVEQLRMAGVQLVVVTGDHKDTALALAKKIGLEAHEKNVMTGAELALLSDAQMVNVVENTLVFARVEPAHKIKIVNAWRKRGKSVAMVGDGVNDAPALKAANIGVAIGSGSDVTQEIADMILLDDNLATIGHAVQEGRIIFDNIRKVVVYLVGHGFAETAFIGLSVILGFPLPLLPTQIFWMNLITDALPYIALSIDHGEDIIMKRQPFAMDEPIINRSLQQLLAISSVIIMCGLFGQYFFLYWMGIDLIRLRSILFTAMVVDIVLFSFSARHLYASIFKRSLRPNYWLLVANAAGLALQFVVLYVPFLQKLFSTVPLQINEWALVFAFGCVQIVAIEIAKVFFLTSPSVPVTLLQDKN